MPRLIQLRHSVRSWAFFLLTVTLLAPLCGFASSGNDGSHFLHKSRNRFVLPTATPTPTPAPLFSIAPDSGVQGKEYEVLVTSEQCLHDSSQYPMKDLRLYAPQGSGVAVSGSSATDCRLTAKVTISADAPFGTMKLQLLDKNGKLTFPLDFTVTGITQGPIPPGLNGKGEVDVMWSVLPDKVTNDNFGGKVQKQFYCVEVIIGNDSGFDLQLSSLGFTIPGLANNNQKIPTTGYRTVRGSLEAFQLVAPRSFVINGLKILGPLLTGFLPFFHAVSHEKNFSEAINIISNPLEKGVENLWPDLTPRELDRLADMTFRDDVSTKTVVPNNVQARILTFIPKEVVFPFKRKLTNNGNHDLDPKNPQDVMRALGNIVLVGEQIQHVNRVRVVSTGLETKPSDTSINGTIKDACDVGVGGVTMTLSAGQDFSSRQVTTAPDGTYTFTNVPLGRTYSVAPKLDNLTFSPVSPGSETFLLNDSKTGLDFRADYAVLAVGGKVMTNDGKPVKDLTILLESTDTGKMDVKTNEAGVFRFEIPGNKVKLSTAHYTITPDAAKYTYDAASKTWKCDDRKVDFIATPKPSPSPASSP